EDAAARRDCTVRWIASRAQIEELLRDRGGAGDLPGVVPLLEGLARASVNGERRLLQLSRREIARWTGGDFAAARAGLDALQRAGLLGWRDEGDSAGYLPRDLGVGPEELLLDWERVVARRNLELRKLKRMEKYAYQRGCRRRYILSYFGEHLGRSRCRRCDRCG
ncbi:MAG: RecQ family zinc-binding domain-containing protein, partial [Gemmatimonadota bacterium]